MELSERMNKRVKHFFENIRDETIVPATSTEILKWITEAAALEAKLSEHLENEGDECPLCAAEAQAARLREMIDDFIEEYRPALEALASEDA